MLFRLTMLDSGLLVLITVPPVADFLTIPGPPRSRCQRSSEAGAWTTRSDLLPRRVLPRLVALIVLPASDPASSLSLPPLMMEDAMDGVLWRLADAPT